MYPLEKIRANFPFLQQKTPVIYLDNAAASQQPRGVIENQAHKHNLTINAFDIARHKVKSFINARCEQEIFFVKSATEAINLVAQAYGQTHFKKGDEIVISAMEHQANIVPWQLLCLRMGIILKIAPIDLSGELIFTAFEKLLSDKTKLVAITHASNVLGTINPIKKIVAAAHSKNIPVLIDGAQAIPHFKVDVQDLDCDFYVFLGHKLYGSTGAGVLYAKSRFLDAMSIYQLRNNTTVHLNVSADIVNIMDVVNLGLAIDYLNSIGMAEIKAYETQLFHYATEQLMQIKGLKIIGQAAEKVPILSFVLAKIQPVDLAILLNKAGIVIRAGDHRAIPLLKFYHLSATVRVSFAMYNTKEEVDALMAVIGKLSNQSKTVGHY